MFQAHLLETCTLLVSQLISNDEALGFGSMNPFLQQSTFFLFLQLFFIVNFCVQGEHIPYEFNSWMLTYKLSSTVLVITD